MEALDRTGRKHSISMALHMHAYTQTVIALRVRALLLIAGGIVISL
jgi:hypothetical protein